MFARNKDNLGKAQSTSVSEQFEEIKLVKKAGVWELAKQVHDSD